MGTLLPLIDDSVCHGCGDCIPACPGGALVMSSHKARLAHPEDCNYCGDCELVCLHGAIQLPMEIMLRSPADSADE